MWDRLPHPSSDHTSTRYGPTPYPGFATGLVYAGWVGVYKSRKKSSSSDRHYSRRMAPDGHSAMQAPGSTFAFPSSIQIAAAGQTSTQVSHPVQRSGSITAAMLSLHPIGYLSVVNHEEQAGKACTGRSPPAPASTAEAAATAAPVRDSAPSEAVNRLLLNRGLPGGLVRFPGRAALRRLRRQDAPAHTPAGHRPHTPGPGTIKSWHFYSPRLEHITHMR